MRIIHLLNWKLSDVKEALELIKEQEFDAIQINPIQPLKEEGYENWWLPYQPCGFGIGNQYGSKEDLISLCESAHQKEILIFGDVICTHVAGKNDGSLVPHEKVDKSLVEDKYLWRDRKYINNWESRYEIVNYCAGLPSFDMQNYNLQDRIVTFLNEMIDCGVDGFRFDSAKSIKTPVEGCDFFPRVLGSLKKNVYNYGEVIFANEELISLYADYLDVLTNSWSRNKDHVVVFSESHDSYYGLGYTKDKTSQEVTQEYKILSETYPKTIYFARSFDPEWMSGNVKEINHQAKEKIKSLYS